jgi:hypothetical protein
MGEKLAILDHVMGTVTISSCQISIPLRNRSGVQ